MTNPPPTSAASVEAMRKALEQIKGLVCGDRHPRWSDQDSVTGSRAAIADIVDRAISTPAEKPAGREPLMDAAVHLMGAWSLAQRFHDDLPKSKKDALWSTRSRDYEAAIERARAALSTTGRDAAAPTSGWRDISTAPKDGEYFLSWSADIGPVVCQFMNGRIETAWDGTPYKIATHWMPLPASPNATSQGGEDV